MIHLGTRQSRYLDSLWSAVSVALGSHLIYESPEIDLEVLLYLGLHLVTAILFLIRYQPSIHASSWEAYLVAGLSTIYVYGYNLSPMVTSRFSDVGETLVLTGAALSLCSLLSLRKNFGVFPAVRHLTTAALYRVVRHPLYAGYILMDLGLVATYPSAWNGAVFVLAIFLFNRRIHCEELMLRNIAEYRQYMIAVKARLLPFVY